ncbi:MULTISPECIES: serine hydrolase domain-containing protein [Kocuria]|uniref:Serine hydrolase n=1 Tax=Kocuria subflava TaxID=1736139 RepID=A0A846TXJ2_9MICC|nr:MULTISPECIES: serine hydrolase [Kocuria]NKE09025.1 serine hydrolase [Kocuria subflava]
MSWLVPLKSQAYRLRDAGTITAERFGSLHQGAPMLEWGSITKTVTARLAQQLDQAGTLDLSAPVSVYLPEAKLPREVDVRSLVTHTSGLPRLPQGIITGAVEARDPYAKYTTAYFDAEVLPTLAAQHSGTVGSFDYSNLGYAVLTRLLEAITEQDWWTLATENVFDPLGITDVSIDPAPERVPVIRTWTGGIRKQWKDTGPFIGAGGVQGTFDALEQYATAIARQSPGVKPLGWMDDPTLWWHNGHNKDHGALIGVSRDGSRILTIHTLGYNAGRADKLAARLERQHPHG